MEWKWCQVCHHICEAERRNFPNRRHGEQVWAQWQQRWKRGVDDPMKNPTSMQEVSEAMFDRRSGEK